jgi:hypothetical protein
MLVLLGAFEGYRCQGFQPNINYTIYFEEEGFPLAALLYIYIYIYTIYGRKFF